MFAPLFSTVDKEILSEHLKPKHTMFFIRVGHPGHVQRLESRQSFISNSQ